MKKINKRAIIALLKNTIISTIVSTLLMSSGAFAGTWKYIFFVLGVVILTGMNIASEAHRKEFYEYAYKQELKRLTEQEELKQKREAAMKIVLYIPVPQSSDELLNKDIETPAFLKNSISK
ncbi:MAG: hypothetical protein ACRCZW_13810 [Lactobacillaceae bacterium]